MIKSYLFNYIFKIGFVLLALLLGVHILNQVVLDAGNFTGDVICTYNPLTTFIEYVGFSVWFTAYALAISTYEFSDDKPLFTCSNVFIIIATISMLIIGVLIGSVNSIIDSLIVIGFNLLAFSGGIFLRMVTFCGGGPA